MAGIFRGARYKRSQGRIARQITFFSLVAIVAVGAWHISATTGDFFGRQFGHEVEGRFMSSPNAESIGRFAVPALITAAGAWLAFRVVNMPRFADFLISVEAEMNKVQWPSKAELYRASLVVIVVIFMLTAILFCYDYILRWVVGILLGAAG